MSNFLCCTVHTHAHVGARTRAASRLIGERPGKSLARPIETSSSHLFPISRLLVIGYRVPSNKRTRTVFADLSILGLGITCEYFSGLCTRLYFSLWTGLALILDKIESRTSFVQFHYFCTADVFSSYFYFKFCEMKYCLLIVCIITILLHFLFLSLSFRFLFIQFTIYIILYNCIYIIVLYYTI